jgi:hypothetical protein
MISKSELPAEIIREITEVVFGTPAELPPLPCDLIFVYGKQGYLEPLERISPAFDQLVRQFRRE